MANEENSSGLSSERFLVGIDDVVIVPMVAVALVVEAVARSAWSVLKHLLDFLFPILLQLMRFPLFTLRILGDGFTALLSGIARFLPIGRTRRAAWREFVTQHWAWLRQKISYRAFEEAIHQLFENGMAWVFRKCRQLTPSAALLVILGALLWLPISFGAATLLHGVLIAKATSLPAWMQLLHPVATIIAKTKLLVLPVYPAAWPRAKQHPSVLASIEFWRFFVTLYPVQKARHRYERLKGTVANGVETASGLTSSFGLRSRFNLFFASLNSAAAVIGQGLRSIAAITVASLASIPLFGTIVKRYAGQYEQANRQPAKLLSERLSGFYSRWSIKFSAEYYEARELEESGRSPTGSI
ncbi:MAG TPA: hypothetical protein VJT13_14345 [Xanthobacteraceae bacterium]|nr:hypothetical protein [Xanthobacteraceae bacterium]